MHRVTLIPGDGIGPDVVEAARAVIAATGVNIAWDMHPAGESAINQGLDPVPEALLWSIRENRRALKGPVTTPSGGGFASVNVRLRQKLDLYGNLRPVRAFPGLSSPFPGVNLLVVRENTEELYTGDEFWVGEGAAVAPRVITRKASQRIARLAFLQARQLGYQRVTVGHKANILKLTDGLFLDSCRAAGADFPELELEELLVDNLCLQLVRRPQTFQVLLLPNLYGDLISDLAAGLVGGLGLAPGINWGDDLAIFEPVHGSAPDLAGTGQANPLACILAGAHLLESLGESTPARRIREAAEQVLAEPNYHTPDLGGQASTREISEALCRFLRR